MYRRSILRVSGIALTMVAIFFAIIPRAEAEVSSWNKGISIVPRSPEDFSSDTFHQSIDELALDGANMISLIIPYYQSNIYSTDIKAGWNTPTDDSVASAIRYIHGKGMRVNLKIHVDSQDSQWRANINPADREGWFGTYGAIVNKYAAIAAANNVEEFTIGTELISMSDPNINPSNTDHWLALIQAVRQRYSGVLTYSANWGSAGWTDEKNHIAFWSALDVVGISAYFPLQVNDLSVASLTSAWDVWNQTDITPLHNRTGKPIEFMEIGYRSVSGNRYQPYNFWDSGTPDEYEQAQLYEAFFTYWNNYSFVRGASLWEWSSDPNAGGPNDQAYTPQNKQAEAVFKKWFSNSGTVNPPSTSPASFAVSASLSPQSPTVGQTENVTVTVNVAQGNATDRIADIEIYNASSQRVFQHFVEHQSFNAGDVKQYSFSWTPDAVGQYVITFGIFTNGWGQAEAWNNNVMNMTVNASSGEPAPAPGGLMNIWWPTDGAAVSGLQPLKAMIPDAPVSTYQMYWQVDGGQQNLMGDSSVDYPHKESLIDVSSWNWHANGPYDIGFRALGRDQNIIAERHVPIFVR